MDGRLLEAGIVFESLRRRLVQQFSSLPQYLRRAASPPSFRTTMNRKCRKARFMCLLRNKKPARH